MRLHHKIFVIVNMLGITTQVLAYRDGYGSIRIYDSTEECRNVLLSAPTPREEAFINEYCSQEKLDRDRLYEAQLQEETRRREIEDSKRQAREELESKRQLTACLKRNKFREEGYVRLGMSVQDVVSCGWGEPESRNRTVGSWGTHEQWVYGKGNYLYIKNGRVTSWQD